MNVDDYLLQYCIGELLTPKCILLGMSALLSHRPRTGDILVDSAGVVVDFVHLIGLQCGLVETYLCNQLSALNLCPPTTTASTILLRCRWKQDGFRQTCQSVACMHA